MAFDNTSRDGYAKYYRRRAELWGWKPAGLLPYQPPRSKPVNIHYNEFHFGEGQRSLAVEMVQATGMTGPTVVIGAGLDWSVEGIKSLGIDCVGTEISPYCIAAQHTTEEQDIRDYCAASGLDPDVHKIIVPANHPAATFADGEWWASPLDIWLPRGKVPRSQETLVEEDGSTRQSRSRIKQALGADIANIVTEQVLNSIDDPDVLQLCDWLQQAATTSNITISGGATVWHMLSPRQWDFTGDGNPADFLTDDPSWSVNTGQQRNTDLNWRTYGEWRALLDANGCAGHRIIATATAIRQGMSAPDGATVTARLIAQGAPTLKAVEFGNWHEAVERVEQFQVI